MESVTGGRLRYVAHEARSQGAWHELRVSLRDDATMLSVEVVYRVLVGVGVVRSWARLANGGTSPVTLESVTSLLASGLGGPGGDLADVDIMWAENDWLGEGRWQHRALRDALPDLGRSQHGSDPRGRLAFTSAGSWSSGTYLPMGAAVNRVSGHAWVWQVEHCGAWHWQVGEHTGRRAGASHAGGLATSAYLAVLGPTDMEHHWRVVLGPGESFETVPAALAVSADGFEDAVGRMTGYRRASRRAHPDHSRLPVIFNDYMNTLMGDPTTERLLPLVSAAARAGAEYFCIDSGWYNEVGEPWWDTVGAWAPSKSRFPAGIAEVLERIRAEGMVPGLWLEPEVVGCNSPVAGQLPVAAFFTRGGQRVVEQGRYQLDFTHPAATAHMDRVVDLLVGELGIGYLKMDYNINIGAGTDRGGVSEGEGLLAHNRAFCAWVDRLLDRHPGLTVESCASGGMRTDHALLSRFQLQSTSDQQDFLRYPPIAAAAPVAITPEQAAVWAYPQPEWTDDEIAFSMCSALLGRVHLSGHLDRMSPSQQRLVAEAVTVYRRARADICRAVPFWPLGLPGWDERWSCLGLRAPGTIYLAVWHRGAIGARLGGSGTEEGGSVVLPVPGLAGVEVVARILYPTLGGAEASWTARAGELSVVLPRTPSACLVALTVTAS